MRIFSQTDIMVVEAAAKADPTIYVTVGKLKETSGFTAAYLATLGLDVPLLKKLESWGMAKRGYMPDKTGSKVRWILVKPEGGEDGQKSAG